VDWTTFLQSIVIGIAGGAGAGLTVWASLKATELTIVT